MREGNGEGGGVAQSFAKVKAKYAALVRNCMGMMYITCLVTPLLVYMGGQALYSWHDNCG